jgi:chromosome segregation ATPase
VAAEQAWLAQGAELEALKRRNAELAQALDGERSSVEGARGRVAALEADLQVTTRELTRTASERDQVLEVAQSERRGREEALAGVARLQAETARLAELETQASEAARLRRELGQAHEIIQQRTQQAESAARQAHDAAAERERLRERFELENSRLSAELSRREAEAQAARRRAADLEQELAARIARFDEATSRADLERQSRSRDIAEAEKRHGEEVGRLKATLVDLERRLEGSARAEAQWRRRASDLEKRAAASPPVPPGEVARLGEKVRLLEEELSDLREENDFLNGEVARFTQKNKTG